MGPAVRLVTSRLKHNNNSTQGDRKWTPNRHPPGSRHGGVSARCLHSQLVAAPCQCFVPPQALLREETTMLPKAEAARQEYDHLATDHNHRWRRYIDTTLRAIVERVRFPAALVHGTLPGHHPGLPPASQSGGRDP